MKLISRSGQKYNSLKATDLCKREVYVLIFIAEQLIDVHSYICMVCDRQTIAS